MNGPAWRPQALKLRLYEGIYALNRGFQITLLSLERLESLGFFRAEYLNAFKIELEHTRASANNELVQMLHQHELEEAGRFDQMRKQWHDQLKDPDDVFFAARERKREIRQQIKDLRSGLERLKPMRRKKRAPR